MRVSRSKYAEREYIDHILACMMAPNAEALRLSLDYGLRIGDVLSMPRSALESGTYSLMEEKTGKRRVVRLSQLHIDACMRIAGRYFVFEHRLTPKKHRTRQAVYKDLKRICKVFRVDGISPHSARKVYAVEKLRKSGDLAKVQRALNHSDPEITLLYALADHISAAQPRTQKNS